MNDKEIKNIVKSILKMTRVQISQSPHDQTMSGIVTQVNSDNTYSIKINDAIYTNVPKLVGNTYSVGNVVKVKAPMGQYRNLYIEGKIG